VYDRQKAKEIYEAARAAGQNTALTTNVASSSFNTVVNIPANEEATIKLTYETLLSREDGKYRQG